MFLIEAANLPISAKIYAALDPLDKLTWTDDPLRAARFESEAKAKQFGANRITNSDWVVQPNPCA